MADKATAIRKRQKIQDSNKLMFIWVAGMSAVVGLCLVVSWFLWQQITFRQDIIDAKKDTIAVIAGNNKAIPILREKIRVFETDRALSSAKAMNEQKALQVILDALPAEGNSLALGASLQKSLADGISGLDIESLNIDPSAEEAGLESTTAESGQISFRMTVTSSNVNALRQLLENFEKSIRVIDIDRLTFERSETQYTLTLDAHAYYEPARAIELREESLPL